jgi:hypothetical protein
MRSPSTQLLRNSARMYTSFITIVFPQRLAHKLEILKRRWVSENKGQFVFTSQNITPGAGGGRRSVGQIVSKNEEVLQPTRLRMS